MTDRTVRFVQNVRFILRGCSTEECYQLALGLRHELARRGLDCTPEADALVAALLAHARVEHARIFSADCTDADLDAALPSLVNLGAVQVLAPPAENS